MNQVNQELQNDNKVKIEKRIIIEKIMIAIIFAIVLFIVFIGFAKILDFWSDGFNFILPSLSVLLAVLGFLCLIRKKLVFAIIYWSAAVIILGFFIGVQIYKITYWN